jgi:hypothetical protein
MTIGDSKISQNVERQRLVITVKKNSIIQKAEEKSLNVVVVSVKQNFLREK